MLLPKEFILVMTRRCNLECAYCPVEKKDKDLSEKKAKEAIDIFLANAKNGKKPLKIRFFGGEPFLQWEKIKRIIKYADRKSKKITFDITTNGALLSKEIFKFVSEQVNMELIISFHKDIFLKKIRPCLDKTSNNKRVIFNLKVDPESVRDLSRNFIFLHNQGINRFNILPAYYVLWKNEEIDGLAVQLRKILWYIRLKGEKYFYIKNVDVSGEVPLFNSAPTLDVDGKMYFSNIALDPRFKRIKKIFRFKAIESEQDTEITRRRRLELLDGSLRKVFKGEVLEDTFLVDRELSRFVKNLKK